MKSSLALGDRKAVGAEVAKPAAGTSEPHATSGDVDAILVMRMTQGDRAALAELYARHVQTLLAFAHGILRGQHDAEDVIHDVFLEAWRRCADYSESRGSVRTWLLVRTRYRALDRLRARVRRRDMAASVEGDVSPSNAGELELAVSDRHRLPAALAQIPEALRHVILLAYFEGLSTLEISSRLGIPTGTVKSRTHAAIKTLRGVLGTTHE